MHKIYPSLAALVLSTAGCSMATMKTPAWAAETQALPVQGYSGNSYSFKEKEIQIGSYAVNNIDRDWDKGSKASAGPWSRDSKRKAYRFDVAAQGRTAHGECTEQAVEHGIAGFAKSKVTFGCTCTEGGSERYKIELVDGEGTAQLGPSVTYNVNAVHDSEEGGQVSKTLGYQFRGAPGQAGVDVSGAGRAWVPPSASEDDLLGLVCGYAGFFLYRPTE
jgi:hypothetical protein